MSDSSPGVSFRAMGTDCFVQLWIDGADQDTILHLLDLLTERVSMLERTWTRFDPASELNRLNATAGTGINVRVSNDLFLLVDHMVRAHVFTGGLYDPTVGQALSRHGYDRTFASMNGVSAAADVPVGPAAGLHGVLLDSDAGTVRLPAGVNLDPGGIGKGLAGDILVSDLLASGVPIQGVLVNLGGDIVFTGAPGHDDQWVINVRNESNTAGPAVGRIVADPIGFDTRLGVATSTTLTRTWAAAGAPRHHVIDPATSQPSTTRVVQTTVATGAGWIAEAASTAALLLNDSAESWLVGHDIPGLLGYADGTVVVVESQAHGLNGLFQEPLFDPFASRDVVLSGEDAARLRSLLED